MDKKMFNGVEVVYDCQNKECSDLGRALQYLADTLYSEKEIDINNAFGGQKLDLITYLDKLDKLTRYGKKYVWNNDVGEGAPYLSNCVRINGGLCMLDEHAFDISVDALFDPYVYGLKIDYSGNDGYSGHFCEFEITDALYLHKLYIKNKGSEHPLVFGKAPAKQFTNNDGTFDVYTDLKHKCEYTGSLFFGNGEYDALRYSDGGVMSYLAPWGFAKMFEVKFHKGVVVEILEFSQFLAAMREDLTEDLDNNYGRNDYTEYYMYRRRISKEALKEYLDANCTEHREWFNWIEELAPVG